MKRRVFGDSTLPPCGWLMNLVVWEGNFGILFDCLFSILFFFFSPKYHERIYGDCIQRREAQGVSNVDLKDRSFLTWERGTTYFWYLMMKELEEMGSIKSNDLCYILRVNFLTVSLADMKLAG